MYFTARKQFSKGYGYPVRKQFSKGYPVRKQFSKGYLVTKQFSKGYPVRKQFSKGYPARKQFSKGFTDSYKVCQLHSTIKCGRFSENYTSARSGFNQQLMHSCHQ